MSWNDILKRYRNEGVEWGSLSEDIHSEFLLFLEEHNSFDAVLDIGFGDGRYLKLLEPISDELCGIDESNEAIQLAKNKLKSASLLVIDMFKYDYPKEKFDLIISFSAIHHGKKLEVVNLINTQYFSLISGGFLFMVLPSMRAQKQWATFTEALDQGDGTFAPTKGPEEGIVHSFFDKKEVDNLFIHYSKVTVIRDERARWVVCAQK